MYILRAIRIKAGSIGENERNGAACAITPSVIIVAASNALALIVLQYVSTIADEALDASIIGEAVRDGSDAYLGLVLSGQGKARIASDALPCIVHRCAVVAEIGTNGGIGGGEVKSVTGGAGIEGGCVYLTV